MTMKLQLPEKKRGVQYMASLAVPLILFLSNPLSMTVSQNMVLCCLFLVIIWWATGIVQRNMACIFLLIVFFIFGNAAPRQVLHFAFSGNFYLIAFSFLLSTGISNSKVADRLSKMLLYRFGKTPVKLVLLSYALGAALIFIIPQPFSRVIIMASIYTAFLEEKTRDGQLKRVMLFSIFAASTMTSMLLLNGDIILNQSALDFAQVSLGQVAWLKAMGPPSAVFCGLSFLVFLVVFRKYMGKTLFVQAGGGGEEKMGKPSPAEIKAIAIMLVVVVLWLTESLHGIPAAIAAVAGCGAMLAAKIIRLADLKTINYGLLLFLVTAFAIGTVMKQSGVSEILFAKIAALLPSPLSPLYLLALILLVMALHMVVGSSVTTMSVAIPSVVMMTEGVLPPAIAALLCYVAVNTHYMLPFHHVTIMIGGANGFYENREVMRFGAAITLFTVLGILFVYIPWWRFVGLY